MIISEKIDRSDLPSILHIYSSQGFFLRYKNQFLKDGYVDNEDEIQNYIETNIPLPSTIVTNDFICNQLIFNQPLTEKQILAAKPVLEKALNLLNQEEIYYVKFLVPMLDLNRQYKTGERFQYNNKIYEVLNPMKGNKFFENNSTDFKELQGASEFLEEWNSNIIYQQGDRINYGTYTYESLIDNNTWSPQAFPAGWKLIQ